MLAQLCSPGPLAILWRMRALPSTGQHEARLARHVCGASCTNLNPTVGVQKVLAFEPILTLEILMMMITMNHVDDLDR